MQHHPALSSLYDQLDQLLPDACPSIACAVSGGADSMALVLMLEAWRAQHPTPPKLIALHVDHRLRERSAEEAQHVCHWLEARTIPCTILTIQADLRAVGGNLQQHARQMRYQLMQDYCTQHHIPVLLTAHHSQDQAETVLMRLMRGSGIDGLAAIPPKRQLGAQLQLIRPLLHHQPEQLKDWLRGQEQPWIEDPSNQDTRYHRNALRQSLPDFAALGLHPHHLSQLASQMQRASGYLEQQTTEWIETHHCLSNEAYASLPPSFTIVHAELGLRILRQLIQRICASTKAIRFSKLEPLYQAIMRGTASATLAGCRILNHRGQYLIFREAAKLPARIPVTDTPSAWDHRFLIHHKANHAPQTSYSFGALGKDGLAQLKAIQAPLPKLPATLLHSLPTFFTLEAPACLPHIDYYSHAWEKEYLHIASLSQHQQNTS